MRDNFENIDQRLKDKLSGFEMSPPTEVWSRIANHNDQKNSPKMWSSWLLGLSIIIIILTLAFCQTNKYNTISPQSSFNLIQSLINPSNNSFLSKPFTPEVTRTYHNQNLIHSMSHGGIPSLKNSFYFEDSNAPNISSRTISEKRQKTDFNSLFCNTFKNNFLSSSIKFEGRSPFGIDKPFTMELNPIMMDRLLMKDYKKKVLIRDVSLNRFSFELGVGVSTFKIQPNKAAPEALNELIQSSTLDSRGLDINASLGYSFTNSISFYAGLNFQTLRNRLKFREIYIETYFVIDSIVIDIDTISGDTIYEIDSTEKSKTTIKDSSMVNLHRLLSIPFGIAYTKSLGPKSALEFSLGGKISLYQASSGVFIEDEKGTYSPISKAFKTKGVFSGTIAGKYLYNLKPKHAIYIEPWMDFGITTITTDFVNHQRKLINGGVRLGYKFRF